MDPRQPPQHPFSRNAASPYGRNPYPPSSASYSPTSHAPSAPPTYPDHQRRPSDPPYPNYGPRAYGVEGGPTHSRHQSASSVGHGSSVNRGMLPPSSPQQSAHNYGIPPRGTQVSAPAGQPSGSGFSSGRELPALPPTRPGMSISDILGGPSPAVREREREREAQHFGSPTSSAQHNLPRTSAAAEYSPAPFRRPQTPEHQRMVETRENRANSAGSPTRIGYNADPRRYGTPQQAYSERREPIRVAPSSNTAPPRPRSQPGVYNASRAMDARVPASHNESLFGRRDPVRSESLNREPAYQRNEYEERPAPYGYTERARQEREATIQREREQRDLREKIEMRDREAREREARERELRDQREREQRLERAEQERSALYQDYLASQQRNYRGPGNRDHLDWLRNGSYEPPRPAYEPIPEQQVAPREREPLHEYPRTTAPQFSGPPAYAGDPRFAPSSQHQSSGPISHYESELRERQRLAQQQQEQQQRQAATAYGGPPPQGTYPTQESPTRRSLEDPQQMQQQVQRAFLGVQEMNRKGRISPLPQAVQGAQGPGPVGGHGSEPGIKSEFGRMFSGIGSGVGAMGVPSPTPSGPQGLPTPGQVRREDVDVLHDLTSPTENGGYNIARSSSRGGRRRKLKEEENKPDDDSSTGRRTPSGRGKRPKGHHHPHQHHHNHKHQHYHRVETLENASSPSHSNLTPFKNIKGAAIPSPPDAKAAPVLHHHHVSRHHHHQITSSKAEPVIKNVVVKLSKKIIRSQAVLDSVAHLPRTHLGHSFYTSSITPVGSTAHGSRSQIGFASTPEPLPNFEGSENCTFTVKVPRTYLAPDVRREITYRRAVWGTDVYTDDSDIIAACIHQGWFRGEWADDIDSSLLGLELDGPPDPPNDYVTAPPAHGPMLVPQNRDLNVTILVLPRLEKYASITRFGIKSREWGVKHDGFKGEHDGLSFMIMDVRWVDGFGGIGRTSKKYLDEGLGNETWGKSTNGIFEESYERGGTPLDIGDIVGVGSQSWWRKAPKMKISIMANDKEAAVVRTQEAEIQQVTERMLENASVHAESLKIN